MNNTRRDALAKIQTHFTTVLHGLSEMRAVLEDAKAEEEEAYSNASQGKQDGDWGQESQACIDAMQTLIDVIDSVDVSEEMDELARAIDRDLEAPKGRLTKAEKESRQAERLPRWAQANLEQMRQLVEQANARAAAMLQDPKEGSMRPVVGDYSSALRGKELPTDIIEFPQVGIRLSYDKHRKAVEIYGMDLGSLVIQANSSNTMYAKVDRSF